jgi:tRNA A-37 threonylcarbamoyl transferase component Bud32/dienelactone hydrolase
LEAPVIGSTFGHYRVLEKIGQGGMGEVFLAEDTALHRRIALKFLPTSVAASAESRARFLLEARAAASLAHPNICVIHEVGEADGLLFIAMEHIEGQTLQQKIRAGALSPDEVLSIASQVVAGLGEAHAKGVIHRDIKSSNIMVTDQGLAKIMDFGIAKVRGGPALTNSDVMLGTVDYMSPEQAEGSGVDHRTDLWSAGVVLYEMLTGALPFPGDHPIAVIHRILDVPPPPINDPARVPSELERVIHRALAKDREARYPDANAMLGALRDYQDAVRAERTGAVNLRWFARRFRRPVVAVPVALAVAGLVLLSVWAVRWRTRVRWAREVALPAIEQMVADNDAWRNLVAPFRLAEQAEAVLGDDPRLQALFAQVSLRINVNTVPEGATVSFTEYGTPDSTWTVLGTTPIEQVRVPVGVFRWKVEKPGYATVLAAASSWDIGPNSSGSDGVVPSAFTRTLDRADSLPAGMVRVSATATPAGALHDFFIGTHEVTNREYKTFVDAGGYRNQTYWKAPIADRGRALAWDEAMRRFVDASGQPGPATWMGGTYPEDQADYPVSGISWYEAAAYAEYAGASLPTSVHWDVARGGFTPMILWPQLGGFAVLAPFSNFGGTGPVAVGSLRGVTAYGAHDMGGNVREWCWNEAPLGRVVRGGAWDDNTYDFMDERQVPPLDRSAKNGLRLASYPDRHAIPAAAFAPVSLAAAGAPGPAEPPVPDALFRVFAGRFSYDKTDLHARVESRDSSAGGWIREKVSFDAAYGGERVAAFLFLPNTARPPYQTVVYFPGSASAYMTSSRDLERYYEFPMFLSFLVRDGRAVLYPIYQGTFERSTPATLAAGEAPTHANVEYVTQLVKDVARSIDYLETRADIDHGKLAYYGMSWGGRIGTIVTAVEPRFVASVLVAGATIRNALPEVRSAPYLPRVRLPTLLLNGKYDVEVDAGVRPLFAQLGTPPGDKKLVLYETDHIPPRAEMIKEALAWLDRYLGPVQQ